MRVSSLEHVTVYRNEREYCGWPFNGGLWRFSDGEIASGFIRCPCKYSDSAWMRHSHLDNLTGEQVIVRSYDDGTTWSPDRAETVYQRPRFDVEVKAAALANSATADGRTVTDDFCLLSGFGIPPTDAKETMFVMCSHDRGKTWDPPQRIPSYDFDSLGGRPSYIVRDDGMILLFGHAGRGGVSPLLKPIVLGSCDGGANWELIGEVDAYPLHPNCIMPYPLALSDGRILFAARRQYVGGPAYTQIYESTDSARTFRFLSRVNDWGAPASLSELEDGTIVCVYGYRRPPFGIRARASSDGGCTWGEELVLRDDGGSADLGYPRTHVRADGRLVTVYYFNDKSDPIQLNGGVRYIGATIWGLG